MNQASLYYCAEPAIGESAISFFVCLSAVWFSASQTASYMCVTCDQHTSCMGITIKLYSVEQIITEGEN